MRFANALCVLGFLVVLGACDGSGEPAVDAGHQAEVAWFEGDADAAFALAREEGRPLFLYWGAEWCPPCHELKAKVFHTPQFVKKCEAFIAVYLDADTEHAQVLGEELGATSYPTVLIFSPEGEELMRMPTDVSAERFVELLDVALGRMRPMRDVLDEVLRAGPAKASPADLNLLAFYSWRQDAKVELTANEKYETFKTLHEQTPDELALEKSRFLSLFLDAAVDIAAEGESPMAPAERAALQESVTALLTDPELRSSNVPFVAYAAGDVIELLQPEAGEERETLARTWDEAARGLEQNEELSVGDRLTAILARIELARLGAEGAPLPNELTEHVRERVAWAAEAVTDDGELQSVMSTMVWLLEEAGLSAEAETLMTERMDDAHAPYYFMSKIAGMKQESDHPEEAVVWFRKAYDSARGRYTRFRWGSIYLRKVMELDPDNVETLESDSLEILGELLTFEDAFAGGNYMRLRQLESAYKGWNETGDRESQLGRIRELVRAACDDFPAGDEDAQRSRCTSFLTDTKPTETAS